MIDHPNLVARTESYVRQTLSGDSTGHDWAHTDNVRRLALKLAAAEGADPLVTELAALLHDVADHKQHGGDLTVGPRRAAAWLTAQGAPAALVAAVARVVDEVSFKGAEVDTPVSSPESAVVQDADRLEALGAVGIGRAFAYGGAKGRPLYDPASSPARHATFEAYRSAQGPTIDHFYEKLLLLKDRMQTPTGRQMAAARHAFMERFLEQFYAEWRAER